MARAHGHKHEARRVSSLFFSHDPAQFSRRVRIADPVAVRDVSRADRMGVRVNQPRKTFALVADGSRARLFSQMEGAPNFVLLEAFEHPETRAKVHDLMADKPGRTFASGPTNHGRSAKEPRTNPKRVEAEKFAREIGRRLATHLDAHAFDDLIVAAPPKFLGLLRHTFSTHDHLLERVIAWHEKDFTMITNLSELAERLMPAEA